MLLAPWRHHGDHAQAHREATGGEEEEFEDGSEGDEEDFDAQDFDGREDLSGEESLDEENCEQIFGEEGAGAEDVVEPHDEAARRIQPEA